MLFFSMGVAPVVFGTLADRHMAGTIVNNSIAKLHLLGYATCTLATLLILLERKWLHAGLAGTALVLTLVSGLVITPPMAEIRTRGAIEALPPQEPERQRFDWLHQLSVGVMATNMLVTGVLICLRKPTP